MPTYLIAHSNRSRKSDGASTGVAQATIESDSERQAVRAFEERHPERDIVTVGVKGQDLR